jgi:hypothetical protein
VSLFCAQNVAFRGSFCTEGDAIGVVIRIGKFTVNDFLENKFNLIKLYFSLFYLNQIKELKKDNTISQFTVSLPSKKQLNFWTGL